MKRRLILSISIIFLLLIDASKLQAQLASDSTRSALNDLIAEQIERIAENTDATLDYNDLIDDYLYYAEYPIDVNSPQMAELRDLHLISAYQYEQLRTYIETFGELVSAFELAGIDGFDQQTIDLLLPVIQVGQKSSAAKIKFSDVLKRGRHQLLMRTEQILEQREGYQSISDSAFIAKPGSRYLGSPQKVYARYAFNYRNKVRAGVTMEKDAGEVFFKNNLPDSIQSLLGDKLRSGFDFYSVHLFAADMGFIKALALGDYHLSFGQGLTMWSGLSFGKSTDATSVMRYGGGVKPNTSVNENLFLRGGAVTFQIKNIDLTAFYSRKKIDANIDITDSVSGEINTITSLQESGLHRTVNELLDKGAIEQVMYGGRVSYQSKIFEIGLTAHHTELEADLQPRLYPYSQFRFVGTSITNMGSDFRLVLPKAIFFGEVARSDNGGMAGIAGVTIQPVGYVSLTAAYRNYEKNYQNLFSNAFAEGSEANNEKGLYLGMSAALAPGWQLKAYADHFSFPWLRYQTDAPSNGHDYLAQLDHQINRRANFYLRFRTKRKMTNSDDPWSRIDYLVNYQKDAYRFQLNYSINESISLKNRIEYIRYHEVQKEVQQGYVVYQDVIYRSTNTPLDLSFRYAIFDADSYDSRVYTYENDVLYAFSIPAFSGKGTRIYLLAKWSISPDLDIWARIGQTWYADDTTIGTGLELIEGNKKTDLKIQLRWKF